MILIKSALAAYFCYLKRTNYVFTLLLNPGIQDLSMYLPARVRYGLIAFFGAKFKFFVFRLKGKTRMVFSDDFFEPKASCSLSFEKYFFHLKFCNIFH
jgi:hypothetical protein